MTINLKLKSKIGITAYLEGLGVSRQGVGDGVTEVVAGRLKHLLLLLLLDDDGGGSGGADDGVLDWVGHGVDQGGGVGGDDGGGGGVVGRPHHGVGGGDGGVEELRRRGRSGQAQGNGQDLGGRRRRR